MRRSRLLAATFCLLIVACEPVTAPTTTTIDILPPPEPIGPTTTTAPTIPRAPERSSEYHGFLPDGTEYTVFIEGVVGETIQFIDASIVLGVNAIGIGTFPAGDTELGYSFEDDVYRVPAGGAAYIDFYDHILQELGDDAEEIIRESITGTTLLDLFPVFNLKPPFRWAEDFELPAAMQVAYHSFTVRRGCDGLAAACSETRAVQVIPIDTQEIPAEAWENLEVFIESPAPRPLVDPNYLDPGPLSPRQGADLIWTGEDMIVWGGTEGLDTLPMPEDLGAAFDPETNEWRMLEPIPLAFPRQTRAAWGQDEMLVLSPDGVFGYDPITDSWRIITAEGMVPDSAPDRMLYLDGSIYVWDGTVDFHVLEVATGEWRVFPAPDPSPAHSDAYFGVLRSVGGEVFAIVVSGGRCFGMDFSKVVGEQWDALPAPSELSCSLANQTAAAGDSLIVWEELGYTSFGFSPDNTAWRPIPAVSLGGMEGPSGPVLMDDDHFMVPRWVEGAIFDAITEEWTMIQFPGQSYDFNTIWTGTEFLSWGMRDFQTFDAWRLVPAIDFP